MRTLDSNYVRPRTITGVIGAVFFFVSLYFLIPGIITYREQSQSFWAYFVSVSPNWPMVKGFFFLGLALGIGLAEMILIGTTPKSTT
jgi:hypothetical protein